MNIFEFVEDYINNYKKNFVQFAKLVDFELNKDSIKEENGRISFSYDLKIILNKHTKKIHSVREGDPIYRLRLFLQSNLQGKLLFSTFDSKIKDYITIPLK